MILAHVEVGENIRNVAIRINRYFQRTIRKNRVSFIVWGRAVVQMPYLIHQLLYFVYVLWINVSGAVYPLCDLV